MILSAARLRPIHTPTRRAMTITMTVATRVMVSVFIASFQSPTPRMTPSHTRVVTNGLRPPTTQEIASRTGAVSHHGVFASRSCSGLRKP